MDERLETAKNNVESHTIDPVSTIVLRLIKKGLTPLFYYLKNVIYFAFVCDNPSELARSY